MTTTPDIDYMNQCIDSIIDQIEDAYSLYESLCEENSISQEQYSTLSQNHKSIDQSITDYYKYLNSCGIDYRDSYLTALLTKEDYSEKIETIEYFLSQIKIEPTMIPSQT